LSQAYSVGQRIQVDHWALSMIDEATSATEPRILSATGFAREDISILHQQIRCIDPAWALGRTGLWLR
jgi:hypothetical protein